MTKRGNANHAHDRECFASSAQCMSLYYYRKQHESLKRQQLSVLVPSITSSLLWHNPKATFPGFQRQSRKGILPISVACFFPFRRSHICICTRPTLRWWRREEQRPREATAGAPEDHLRHKGVDVIHQAHNTSVIADALKRFETAGKNSLCDSFRTFFVTGCGCTRIYKRFLEIASEMGSFRLRECWFVENAFAPVSC